MSASLAKSIQYWWRRLHDWLERQEGRIDVVEERLNTMFSGSWSDDDVPSWNGSSWSAKQLSSRKCTGANQTSTSTTYADVTNLQCAVTKTGGARYNFHGVLFYTTSATTEGIGVTINYTGTASNVRYGIRPMTSVSAFAHLTSSTTFGTAHAPLEVGPGATATIVEFWGSFNSTATGTLAPQIRAETGGGNSVTVNVGSHMEVTMDA